MRSLLAALAAATLLGSPVALAAPRVLGAHNVISAGSGAYVDVRLAHDAPFWANHHIGWPASSTRSDGLQFVLFRAYNAVGDDGTTPAEAYAVGWAGGFTTGADTTMPAGDYRMYSYSSAGPAQISLDLPGQDHTSTFTPDIPIDVKGGDVALLETMKDGTEVYGRDEYLPTDGLLIANINAGQEHTDIWSDEQRCMPLGKPGPATPADYEPGCAKDERTSGGQGRSTTIEQLKAGWTGFGANVTPFGLGAPYQRDDIALWVPYGPSFDTGPTWPADSPPAPAVAPQAPRSAPRRPAHRRHASARRHHKRHRHRSHH